MRKIFLLGGYILVGTILGLIFVVAAFGVSSPTAEAQDAPQAHKIAEAGDCVIYHTRTDGGRLPADIYVASAANGRPCALVVIP